MSEISLPADAVWDDLTFSEQFMLWAIRMWAQLSGDPERAHDFISPAFDRVGVDGAGASFHSFMCGVTAAARRRIEVRCPRSSEICDDERGLMHALQTCQTGRTGAAHAGLAGYVHHDAIGQVMLHASLLMRACRRGGVILRPVYGAAPATWQEISGEEHAERSVPSGITVH